MDEKIKEKFAYLESKIAELEKKIQKVEDDTGYYIDLHGDEHHQLSKMIYPSYFKTHPEFCKDMDQLDAIVNRKKSDPKNSAS